MHRPLTVFAGTWNVGNAPPPADLSSWLEGVEGMEHDLVAIGVQVCVRVACVHDACVPVCLFVWGVGRGGG